MPGTVSSRYLLAAHSALKWSNKWLTFSWVLLPSNLDPNEQFCLLLFHLNTKPNQTNPKPQTLFSLLTPTWTFYLLRNKQMNAISFVYLLHQYLQCASGSQAVPQTLGMHPIHCRFSGNNMNLCTKENREGHHSCWQKMFPKVESHKNARVWTSQYPPKLGLWVCGGGVLSHNNISLYPVR